MSGHRDRGLDRLLDSLPAPVALLFLLGGCLWFLPVLGLWMLPLGLILIGRDVPRSTAPTSGRVRPIRR